MPRISVYVSDEMKARMDAAGESVNWSAAAQRAFDTALRETEWRLNMNEIEAAVERLKGSREKFSDLERQRGVTAGRDWGLREAEYPELKAIAEAYRSGEGRWDLEAVGATALFALGVDGENLADGALTDWWERVQGDHVERLTDEFAEGFAEGASQVWNEVENQF